MMITVMQRNTGSWGTTTVMALYRPVIVNTCRTAGAASRRSLRDRQASLP
jgi:hypothetical protein